MSHRFDTPWITGSHLYGNAGLGVVGSLIPSTGDSGAGYAYNDLSLPADNDKEICGRITTWPASGTLTAYEDTSFEFSAADGAYSFSYQLYVDGVATGSPATVSLYVGSVPVEITAALGTATASGHSATVSLASVISAAIGEAVASGYQSSITSASVINSALGVATAAGFRATVSAGNEIVIECATGEAVASGYTASIQTAFTLAAKLGIAVASGKTAVITALGQYVRAPDGSGPSVISASSIRPQSENTARPLSANTTRH